MNLFDDIPRTDLDPQGFAEADFPYLNRSARPAMARVRQLWEGWFAQYPIEQQTLLARRLRSDKDNQHHAAATELFVHALLMSLECGHIDVEPASGPEHRSRPDFRLATPTGEIVYLEVTTHLDDWENKQYKYYKLILAFLDSLHLPCWISVHLVNLPTQQPSVKALEQYIRKHLEQAEVRDQLTEAGGYVGLPLYEDSKGLALDIILAYKSPENYGYRTVGSYSMGGTSFDHKPLKSKITDKIRQRPSLAAPYLIVVNELGLRYEEHFLESLFGTEIPYVPQEVDRRPIWGRDTDGVWHQGRNSRLSACLFVKNLRMANVGYATLRLFHNPWAKYPLLSCLSRLPQAVPNQNRTQLHPVDGMSLSELFGLSERWPEE